MVLEHHERNKYVVWRHLQQCNSSQRPFWLKLGAEHRWLRHNGRQQYYTDQYGVPRRRWLHCHQAQILQHICPKCNLITRPNISSLFADQCIDNLQWRKRDRNRKSWSISRGLERDQCTRERRTDPNPQQRHAQLSVHQNLGWRPGASIFVRKCRASSWRRLVCPLPYSFLEFCCSHMVSVLMNSGASCKTSASRTSTSSVPPSDQISPKTLETMVLTPAPQRWRYQTSHS